MNILYHKICKIGKVGFFPSLLCLKNKYAIIVDMNPVRSSKKELS